MSRRQDQSRPSEGSSDYTQISEHRPRRRSGKRRNTSRNGQVSRRERRQPRQKSARKEKSSKIDKEESPAAVLKDLEKIQTPETHAEDAFAQYLPKELRQKVFPKTGLDVEGLFDTYSKKTVQSKTLDYETGGSATNVDLSDIFGTKEQLDAKISRHTGY